MASNLETLIFELIGRDRSASAAFDNLRRSIDGTTGATDKNTASLNKNTQAQTSAMGGAVGLGVAFSAMLSPIAAAGSGVVAFAAVAAPSVLKVKTALTGPGGLNAAWGTLDNRQRNMALGVQALGHRFTDLSAALEPRTAQVFGTALGLVNSALGPLSQLAGSAGTALGGFLVQFSQRSGLNQFITFMAHEAGPAIQLLGTDITNIAHAVFALLESWGGLGLTELKAVTGVITGITGSLTWLSEHAPGLTAAAIALGGVALALSKFGLLSGVLKLTGIAAISGQMVGFAAATKGATIAEKGLLATTTALDAVTPWGWAILGAAALGGLIFATRNYRDGTQSLIDTLAKQDHATGLNVAGYAKLAKALKDTSIATLEQRGAVVTSEKDMAGFRIAQNELTAGTITASQKARNLRSDFTNLGQQYGLNTDQVKTLIVKSGALNDILAANGKITPEAAQKMRDWAASEDKATHQTNLVAIAVSALTAYMQKNVTAMLGLIGDELSWRSAMQQATAQLNSNSAGLKGNSANAIANKQAVLGTATAVDTFAQKQLTLKGNLGKASDDIRAEIRYLRGLHDQSGFTARLIDILAADLRKIKSERVNINVHGSGSWDILPSGKHIPGGSTGMAAGGRIPGYGGGDRHLRLLESGEAVVDKDRTRQFAPVLRAMGVPGMAAGGVVGSYSDGPAGMGRWLVNESLSTLTAIERATANAVLAGIRAGGGFGGGGGGPGGSVEAVARALFPWAANQWPSFNYVEMREAGYNLRAQNPTSGAYGVAQFINGPSEYYQWGGNPVTAAGQFTAMFNYIRSRYGTPYGAALHEAAFNWYDQGGWLPPGLSLAMNGTGRPERVGGGGGVTIGTLNITLPPGSPRDHGRQIVEYINQAATGGVRIRKSAISANG